MITRNPNLLRVANAKCIRFYVNVICVIWIAWYYSMHANDYETQRKYPQICSYCFSIWILFHVADNLRSCVHVFECHLECFRNEWMYSTKSKIHLTHWKPTCAFGFRLNWTEEIVTALLFFFSSTLCHRLQRKRFPRNKNIQFRILFSTNEEVMNEGRKDRQKNKILGYMRDIRVVCDTRLK